MNNKIGVLDSGIGGLTTLDEIVNLLPHENFIYYADSLNNPYGNKSDKELFKIVDKIVKYFIEEKVKMIVIACNTATTKCISKLRNKYPNMIFVGTEPAIKVACDNDYKTTLVMATPGTIDSDRTHELIEQYKKEDESIILLPCEGLANAIETNDKKKVDEILDKLLTPFEYTKIDAVVLGCTHYPMIADKIQSYFKNSVLIDGNKGVARRVKDLLTKENLLNNSNKKGEVIFTQNK